ncbi:MAG: DUF58 domain-containing protein [Cyclobacteriaceae bacterium]
MGAYFYESALLYAKLATAVAGIVVCVDTILLYVRHPKIEVYREMASKLSLGSSNTVIINLQTDSNRQLRYELIDELPVQLQERSFFFSGVLEKVVNCSYELVPKERGRYHFGDINLFVFSRLGFVSKRNLIKSAENVAVYPSIQAMKEYSLYSMKNVREFYGAKKRRRLGYSYEFEQIKEYVLGDDIRNINWKATARASQVMINQFEEEKSQQVYTLIDKSRTMNMAFGGMSLLDYAINAALVISNVSLQKQDKAGLVTFSDKIGNTVKALNRPGQMNKVLETLYNEKEREGEADYELLYQLTTKLIHGRSLLFLFTNIETNYSLERILPVLRKLSKRHVLVVIFFRNVELENYAYGKAKDTEEVYLKTIAEKMYVEKEQLMLQLNKYGIQTIFTEPGDLIINTVNKYLELKAKGII